MHVPCLNTLWLDVFLEGRGALVQLVPRLNCKQILSQVLEASAPEVTTAHQVPRCLKVVQLAAIRTRRAGLTVRHAPPVTTALPTLLPTWAMTVHLVATVLGIRAMDCSFSVNRAPSILCLARRTRLHVFPVRLENTVQTAGWMRQQIAVLQAGTVRVGQQILHQVCSVVYLFVHQY